jgi:hypothetical protein
MAIELSKLDRAAEPVRTAVQSYAAKVASLAGENLVGLTLYGLVVTPAFDSHQHVARNLLVLNVVDLQMLRGLAREGAQFGRQHIAAPLVMTPTSIQASLDTFPLELIEIQQHHVTILGEDLWNGLQFEANHVRLQCEREIKTLMIGLRQGLLTAAGRERLLGRLEMNVAESLIRAMRGLLWLEGQTEPKLPAEVLSATEELMDRKLPGIRGGIDPVAEHGWDQFVALYQDLEALGTKADVWK